MSWSWSEYVLHLVTFIIWGLPIVGVSSLADSVDCV